MSSPVTPASAAALDAQRGDAQRNIRVLVAAQALGGASPAIIVSLGGLVGQMLASNPALATLPVSIYNLGLALGTIPAALLMQRAGRRTVYLLGALMGLMAGLVSAFGIMSSAFTMFCVGTFIAGFYGSCVQSYRFAAADTALPDDRARAISRVMIGGLAAAVIGPQMVIWTRDMMPAAPFAGSFFGQAALALLALPLLMRLNAPPPVVAKQENTGRPLSEILRNPRFLVALMAGVVTYGLMSFVMTASPMAMVGCGHSVGEAALGIQWHVLAMFAPSFFTGRLIARFGKGTVTAVGLLLIAASGAVALSGLGLGQFWLALVLLGVGWNFGFIGATAMVTDCYRPEERAKVQALNDFSVFGTVAIASFSSGRLLSVSGWDTVNWMMFPIVGVVLALMGWEHLRRRNQQAVGA